MHHRRVILPGSSPPPAGGWLRRGRSDPDRRLGITVHLRERPAGPSLEGRLEAARVRVHRPGRHLTRAELAAAHGPDAEDVRALARFAEEHGLSVGRVDAVACAVELSGRVADVNRAFGIELTDHVHPHAVRDGRAPVHRGHAGPLHLPVELSGIVRGVAGLSDRPLARAHFLAAPRPVRADTGRSAVEVAAAYGMAPGLRADGQTIGILALGGGYTRRDLDAFCAHASVGVSPPAITDVSVHGARNAPTNGGDPDTADGEIALDLQTVAAVAPGAVIRVYFAPNTERGFVDSLARALGDGCSVVSISWGAPEALWPVTAMIAVDRACQAALAMGVSVFCSAGDSGSTDGMYDLRSHADFPASSPHAVACGGTALPGLDRRRETAWNDLDLGGGAGGGAVSDVWSLPAFQRGAGTPPSVNDGRRRRTVPDISANAAPSTGYRVMVGGRWNRMGGTSAAAPLLAGMAALINSELARRRPGISLGDVNAALYSRFAPAGAVNDIADGSTNGGQYFARPGYDAVTGWGSPDHAAMLELAIAALEVARPAEPPGASGGLEL